MFEFSRSLAVVIGINQYSNGISSLQTAVNDAREISRILKQEHKYDQVWLYFDRKATLQQLQHVLNEILVENTQPDDRLLFYFAGHGIALNGDEGPEGYLIPQDAKFGEPESFLAMSQLQAALSKLPCRHFLGILDCCFAGAFRWSSTRDLGEVPQVLHKERYDRFIQDPAWQVITSAASDQKAWDFLALNSERGRVGNHSPFATALIEALAGKADIYPPASNGKPPGDGVITANELYLYLRHTVEPATEENRQRQTPGIWPLKKHDKGEYIFLTPGHQLNLPPAPPLDKSKNPYRGLQSFEENHSELFFGRSKLVKDLQDFVKTHPFTVVLGASGSGKSSLVKAGLIPKLKQDAQVTRETWCILPPIRPGQAPFQALNNALVTAQLAAVELQNPQKTLARSIAVWAKKNPNFRLFIFIDQSEEIITLCPNETERQEFFQQILTAIDAHRERLRVVLSLRSDFEPQIRDMGLKFAPEALNKLGAAELRNCWQRGQFRVPPMTRTELREAIEKPAEARVMYFQPHDLVEQIVDEVAADMRGALPLLSFTLSELYFKYLKRQWDAQNRSATIDRALTQEDYQSMGGVIQSLTQKADEEYEALIEEEPAYAPIIRHVMLRMVTLGGGELARRQVPLSELEYSPESNDLVKEVIERFTNARLLVKGEDAEGNLYVEPAHDALVRSWQKLLMWKQEDEESLILQRRLTAAAMDWKMQQSGNWDRNTALPIWLQRLGRKSQQLSLLWNANPRLNLLKQILNSQTDNWFNQLETEFVLSSLKRRRNNYLRAYGLGALVLTGVLLFAFIRWNQDQQTQSLNLATSSKQLLFRHQQLDALVDGLKAEKILQRVVDAPSETTIPVVTALQQVVYGVKEYNRLQGHNTAVSGVSFCNDGKTIASVSQDGIIKRWGLDGMELDTINGQTAELKSVSFNRDCKMVALGTGHGSITLWNLDTKKSKKLVFLKGTATVQSLSSKKSRKLVPLKGLTIPVTSVGFSPDSKLLASGTEDGIVILWSVNGDQLWTIQGHSTELDSENINVGTVGRVSFSPDGKTIVSNGDTTKLWSLDGKLKADIKVSGDASFSPDSKMLVLVDYQNITLWDLNGNALERHPINSGGTPSIVSFSPDGKTIASANRDGMIKLWNLNGNELTTMNGLGGSVDSVSFSLDGKTLAAGNADGSIELWSLSNERPTTLKLDSSINCFSFSPDGKTIALGGFKKVTTWNLDGEQLKTFKVAPGPPRSESSDQVVSLSFSPDGKSLATSANYIIQLWSLENGRELWKRPESENYSSSFGSVSFSPDGKIATPGGGKLLKLFSLDGKELKPLTLEGYSEDDFSFSPDGKTLAALNNDNTIQLWRTADGKPLPSLKNEDRVIQAGSKTQATSISFSPDSKSLASGNVDGSIRFWNLENGKHISPSNRLTAKISSVNFSPDGKILALGSADGTIRLWSLNGTELDKIEGYKSSRAYFSPDGKILAVVGNDTVTLLNLDLNDLVRRGCDRARDYLKNNSNVSESDRHLCDDVPELVAKDNANIPPSIPSP